MGIRRTTCFSVFLGNVFLSLVSASDSLQMTVRPDADSAVIVSSRGSCTLCTGNASAPCDGASVSLTPGAEVALTFSCPDPLESSYLAEVRRTIACSEDSCTPTTGATQASFLRRLSRSFFWELGTPGEHMAVMDILGEGLSEAEKTPVCADGLTYVLSRGKPNGGYENRTYCRGGAQTRFLLQSGGSLALLVAPGKEVPPVVFTVSTKPLKGPSITLTLDPDVSVTISRQDGGLNCAVCTAEGKSCNNRSLLLSKEQTVVEFACLLPQEVFNVQLGRKIECTGTACTPATGKVLPKLLTDFHRTFLWQVGVPKRTVVTLDFPPPGLKEMIAAEGACQGGPKYSLSTTTSRGEKKETTYCRDGPETTLSLPGDTWLEVRVPRGQELEADAFTAKAVPREGKSVTLTLDPDTRVLFRREGEEPECEVCVDQKCDPKYLWVEKVSNASVEFGCPRPQEFYTVEVIRDIDCTPTSCREKPVQAPPTLFPDFDRVFSWDLKVPPTQNVQMDFPEPGLRQVPDGEACPDGHTYSLVTYLRSGPVKIGTYCQGGTLSAIQVRYKARMILEVPRNRALDTRDFKLSVGPETNTLAILKVDLPRGVSETAFTTANPTGNFPDGKQMTWDFRVPGMHNYTVRFQDYRLPEECLANSVQLQYLGADKKETQLGLRDPQPRHKQGNFNMSLTNCMTNQTLGGLMLNFTVSVMRSGHPVLCTVDLTKKADLSLRIKKVGTDPYCEMSADSVMKDTVDIAAGTVAKLSFLDCPSEDLRLTASRLVGCQDSRSCTLAEGLLTVPGLDACLPMGLHSFTWCLRVPENGTVGLGSPTPGGLRQDLPGQECNASVKLRVAEGGNDSGYPIGTFCQQGVLEKLQVRANVSVTVVAKDLAKAKGPFINISITDEISEHIIYTVRPQISNPAQLATPNWPGGMKPSSTVSWIVHVPSQYRAVVQFINYTKPICDKSHTSIKVQPMSSKEETLSRREDEDLEDQLVEESFYLNMTSCPPDSGSFSALTKVTLQPHNNRVGIILGVLGALLLLLLVFVAVWLILKKKKSEKAAREASIYIGKGNVFRTGDAHFGKQRTENTSHIYDSIDEDRMYGHLLRDSTYAEDVPDHFNGMQVDSYRTFVGPVDSELPAINEDEPRGRPASGGGERFQTFLDPAESFLPPRPRTPIAREESLGFQDRRMVDNEMYTFKSTGGFNTIRLSGADQQEEEFL